MVREKILVIEDDRELRDTICETLKCEGFPAEGVESVAEAELVLKERGPYRAALVALRDRDALSEKVGKRHRTPLIVMHKPVVLDQVLNGLLHNR